MDLVLRNTRPYGHPDEETLFDIGIEAGRIAAIAPRLEAAGPQVDLGGRLVAPGFVESHIHLDKSCLLDRCQSRSGDLAEAIQQVAEQKKRFTEEDVLRRARRTLEKSIVQGTTHVRTHVEVDPVIGLRGFDGVMALAAQYRWAVDIEVCVFPQEGLLNNPGTDELMVAALRNGARVVGAAPYTDTDPHGQIDRVFELAREFDADIDMHLDFGNTAEYMDIEYVCERTAHFRYGGRVTVGHVTKLSTLPPVSRSRCCRPRTCSSWAGTATTTCPAAWCRPTRCSPMASTARSRPTTC
jgi:cytosine deaminase